MANFVSYSNAQEIMTVIGQKFSALGGAYVAKGSRAFADLPSVRTKDMVGYVYNVTNGFTTTADFIEGAGKKYKAGTIVVIVDATTIAYNEVTPVGTEDPSAEGWYERSGSVGAYVYTLTTDTAVNSSKTYYKKTETGAVDGRLPLPDEVFDIINAA